MTQSFETHHYNTIVASHNSRTIRAYSEALNLSVNSEIIGINPEDEDHKEPESDQPILPVLFKLARIEEITEKMGLTYFQIVASDVVWSKDGEVKHRPPELRDTLSAGAQDFTDAMIAHLITMYGENSFESNWAVSMGLSYPHKKDHPRRRIVTDPVTIIGEFPRLSPDLVSEHLEPHASPGIALVELAKKQKIRLAMQTDGSDKRSDISHEKAVQLLVNRSFMNRRMYGEIKSEFSAGTSQSQQVENVHSGVGYRQVPMKNVMKRFLEAVR